jgi:hypothetical protein
MGEERAFLAGGRWRASTQVSSCQGSQMQGLKWGSGESNFSHNQVGSGVIVAGTDSLDVVLLWSTSHQAFQMFQIPVNLKKDCRSGSHITVVLQCFPLFFFSGKADFMH